MLHATAPSNCLSGDIRLSQGSQGTIEICIDGYWGTICDSLWDNTDASVTCRQQGYPYLGKITQLKLRLTNSLYCTIKQALLHFDNHNLDSLVDLYYLTECHVVEVSKDCLIVHTVDMA